MASLGFPGSSAGKESTCDTRDLGLIPGLGRSPGGGNGNPLQYFCLENPHGQRSLAGYSLWVCKESDTTERLRTVLFTILKRSGACQATQGSRGKHQGQLDRKKKRAKVFFVVFMGRKERGNVNQDWLFGKISAGSRL